MMVRGQALWSDRPMVDWAIPLRSSVDKREVVYNL